LFQRSSAKERITREGDHRQRRQAKNSCALHAESGVGIIELNLLGKRNSNE
jgi:hypothetical protein